MTTVKVVPLCRWCPVLDGVLCMGVVVNAKSETQARKLIGRELQYLDMNASKALWVEQDQPVRNMGEVTR